MKTKIDFYREEIKRLMTPESLKKRAWDIYRAKKLKPGQEYMIHLITAIQAETEAWRNAERLYMNQVHDRAMNYPAQSATWHYGNYA